MRNERGQQGVRLGAEVSPQEQGVRPVIESGQWWERTGENFLIPSQVPGEAVPARGSQTFTMRQVRRPAGRAKPSTVAPGSRERAPGLKRRIP